MALPQDNLDSKQNENSTAPLKIPKCLENGIKVNLSQDLKMINPDIHELFNKYNKLYFDSSIICEVKWIESEPQNPANNSNNNGYDNTNPNKKPKPKKKKKYAGKCTTDNTGFCCITLEKSILQFKSQKYVIETLIHQMIHSYLILHTQKPESIGHSAEFKLLMSKINQKSHGFLKLTTNNKQCKKNDDFPSEIIPNQLYLGNIHHALTYDTYAHLKITHVVNCTQTIDNKFEAQGIKYIRVPVNDKTSVSILPYFVKAIRFIESVREENGGKNANRILIHCHAGISRSTTIVIAYLMYSWKLTMFDAITHVQLKRYIIQPNQGFKNQLLDFYLYLEENEGNLVDFEKKYAKKTGSPINGAMGGVMDSDKIGCNPMQIMNGNGNKKNNENESSNTKQHVQCFNCQKFFTKKYINKHILDECTV